MIFNSQINLAGLFGHLQSWAHEEQGHLWAILRKHSQVGPGDTLNCFSSKLKTRVFSAVYSVSCFNIFVSMNQQYMLNKAHSNRNTHTTRSCINWSMKILWPEALRSLRLGSPGAGAQHTLIPWLVVHKYGQEREFNYNFPVSLICVTSSLWHSPLPFCIILVTCQGLQG